MTRVLLPTTSFASRDIFQDPLLLFRSILLFRWVTFFAYIIGMTWIAYRFPFLVPFPLLFGLMICSLGIQIWACRVSSQLNRVDSTHSLSLWRFYLFLYGDVFFLTLSLGLSGGPYNPLNFLYLLHISFAVLLLKPKHYLPFLGFILFNLSFDFNYF